MRSAITLLLALGMILTVAHGSGRAADDATTSFLNADNWEGLSQFWSNKDGTIVGTAPADLKFNTFLCSKKPYKDFELKFQVRLKDGKGNSGVQIRSKIVNPERFAVNGPQADMASGYWGSLYGEGSGMMQKAPDDVVKRAVKPTDFNDYYIKCVGKHVTIKINGETTVDGDFDKMPAEGIIAWQLHGNLGAMEVIFKNIEFKDLSK